MGRATSFLKGALLGAGAMYFFDPRMGKRRRALVEDQLRRMSRQTACGVDAGLRDLGNRTQGTLHEIGSRLHGQSGQRAQQRGNGGRRPGRTGWSPAARLLGAVGGSTLLANCVVCRSPAAMLGGALGLGLFARSLDAGPSGVHVTKSLEIDAPVERVFDFFAHPENYLRISNVVTNVEVFGDGRFAKKMAIAGILVHFEERFTCRERPHLIETRSEPASAARYTKQLRFEEAGDGRTRLHLHFNYHPPGGAIGHAVASAFGIDAKSLLMDLLMRAKFFLETGREPRDVVNRRGKAGVSAGRPVSGQRQESREFATSSPQGPGAPARDVHRAGVHDFRSETPWPPSAEGRPDIAGAPGAFPPTID